MNNYIHVLGTVKEVIEQLQKANDDAVVMIIQDPETNKLELVAKNNIKYRSVSFFSEKENKIITI